MLSTVLQSTARARLLAEMERMLAADAGLGVLVTHNGRPDLAAADHELQTAWARGLIALHGANRAASVYAEYAARRQRAVTAPIGSWDDLVLNTKPLGPWSRDIHGFLCVVCTETFTSVVIDGGDAVCNRCAREHSTPADAVPQWHAASHHQFLYPGLLGEEAARGETAIKVRYDDGEQRDYLTGEAGLLAEDITSLPGFTRTAGDTHGASRDTISLTITARTERVGADHCARGFDIDATFTYDPTPDGNDPHGYGFRLDTARLTPYTPRLGHYNRTSPHVSEYTDAHELLAALLGGLYASSR